MSFTFIITLS